MAAEYFVTEQESRLIAPLAVRWAIGHSMSDPRYMRSLIQAYLGPADAAEEAVLDRCARDPEYLESIVKKYVASLDEQAVIAMLRSTAGTSLIAEQLGFDPFDPRRREAYHAAHRFINRPAQGAVLAIGAVVFCLVCLFPPWKMERWQKQDWNPCASGGCFPPPDKKLEVKFVGFRYAYTAELNPPGADARASTNGQNSRIYVVYGCYFEMLFLEWLGLLGLMAILCAALRDTRSFELRVAAIEAARSAVPDSIERRGN